MSRSVERWRPFHGDHYGGVYEDGVRAEGSQLHSHAPARNGGRSIAAAVEAGLLDQSPPKRRFLDQAHDFKRQLNSRRPRHQQPGALVVNDVANPGHTLFSVPVFCLIGGYAIWAASEYLTAEPQRLAEGALGGALVVNLLLFLNFFSLPVAAGRFVTAVTVGVYESSLGDLRGLEDVHRTTVSEWKALSEVPRPSVIVTTDEAPQRWFMHWLMLRYYAPKSDIWVLAAKRTPRQVLLVRRNDTLSTRTGDVIDVPVPAGGRILWVLESRGPFETALERTIKIEKRVRLSYTDLAPDAAPFQVLNFRFVPTMPSALAP